MVKYNVNKSTVVDDSWIDIDQLGSVLSGWLNGAAGVRAVQGIVRPRFHASQRGPQVNLQNRVDVAVSASGGNGAAKAEFAKCRKHHQIPLVELADVEDAAVVDIHVSPSLVDHDVNARAVLLDNRGQSREERLSL